MAGIAMAFSLSQKFIQTITKFRSLTVRRSSKRKPNLSGRRTKTPARDAADAIGTRGGGGLKPAPGVVRPFRNGCLWRNLVRKDSVTRRLPRVLKGNPLISRLASTSLRRLQFRKS